MRNWIDSKTYETMIKASLGVSLPIVIVTGVMFFTGEPITSFERKLAGYILVASLIVFIWSFLSLIVNFSMQFFKPDIAADDGNGSIDGASSGVPPLDKVTLRSQFVARFVTDGHKNEPIYDTIDQVLNEKKEGAFAARVIGCAADAPLNWLKSKPSSKEMVTYFGVDAIHSETSYNGGLSKFRKDSFKEGANADAINIMKDKLKELQNKKMEEQRSK